MKVVIGDHVTVGHHNVVIASWLPSIQIVIIRPRNTVMATTTRTYYKYPLFRAILKLNVKVLARMAAEFESCQA